MIKTIDKGLLLSFSGVDGCGKTSVTEELEKIYINDGYACKRIEIMNATDLSKKIKAYIIANDNLESTVEAHLFLAAIEDGINKVIKPLLDKGYIVLCDRYVVCTYIYQYKLGNSCVIPRVSLDSDVDFILDVDPKIGMERIKSRGAADRLDEMSIKFYDKIREEYLEYAKFNNRHSIVINAEPELSAVVSYVKHKIDKIIREHICNDR
jgi:dTMP kinase